jgi:hypothetical protein
VVLDTIPTWILKYPLGPFLFAALCFCCVFILHQN